MKETDIARKLFGRGVTFVGGWRRDWELHVGVELSDFVR